MFSFFRKRAEERKRMVEAVAMTTRNTIDQQARIEKAVALYGREVTNKTPMLQAFKIIADCLEEGAPAPKKSKKV